MTPLINGNPDEILKVAPEQITENVTPAAATKQCDCDAKEDELKSA